MLVVSSMDRPTQVEDHPNAFSTTWKQAATFWAEDMNFKKGLHFFSPRGLSFSCPSVIAEISLLSNKLADRRDLNDCHFFVRLTNPPRSTLTVAQSR